MPAIIHAFIAQFIVAYAFVAVVLVGFAALRSGK